MKNKYLILLILLLGYSSLFAQQYSIKGKVVSESGEPLPGATVVVKNSYKAATTLADGSFSLVLESPRAELIVSFIGFTKTVVTVESTKTDYLITLKEDLLNLSEVVVTGYSVEKKRDIAGAVGSIKGAEIENLPVASVDKAIQGRLAGVQVQANNGIPGGPITVRIRGTGSINAGNDPLWIIDGVPLSGGDLSRGQTSSNTLAGINPNDIESIDILKDASAAIYGSQAANGVIIVTTKRGKSGKTKFGVNYRGGFSELLSNVNQVSSPEFLNMVYEARSNFLLNSGRNPASDALTNSSFTNLYGYTRDNFNEAATYDWIKAISKTGKNHQLELTASGGSDKTTFYLSGAFNAYEGHVVASDFTRGNIRLNLDHQANSRLKFGANINLASYTQNAVQPGNSLGSIIITAMYIPPVQRIYNEDGSYADPLIGNRYANPLKGAEYDKNKATTNQLIGNFGATYSILPNLTFRSSYNLDYTDLLEDRYIDPRTVIGASYQGQADALHTRQVNWSTDQVFNYSSNFGVNHNFTGLLGFNYRHVNSTFITAQGRGFPNELFNTLQSAATPYAVSSGFTGFRLAGYFTKLNYSYKNRYIANATLRYDGSSRFGKNKQYGWFPSLALAWSIADEEFLSNSNFITDLKLRTSYGVTGNGSIGDFASRTLYTGAATNAYNGVGGVAPNGLGDDNLTWEENRTINLGLDYGILKNRISGTIEVFRRTTNNLLLSRTLPSSSGFSSITQNVGKVKNEGLELQVSTVNLSGKFKWTTDYNWTWIKSEVLDLGGQDRLGTTYFVGEPLALVFQPAFAGVNPATGRGFWYDANGDPTYVPVTSGDLDARRIIGTTLPKSYGGLTNTFAYGNLELSIFFQGQFGNLISNNSAFYFETQGATEANFTQRAYDRRWQNPGDITDFPRAFAGVETLHRGLNQFSSRNYEDGSYIRLKQLNISYNVPSSFVKGISAKVYAQATNLLTFTGYTGFDPELSGTDIGTFPQGKTFTAGVSFSF